MRLFRRPQDLKPSVLKREAVSSVADAEEVRENSERISERMRVAPVAVPPSPPSYDGIEDSDVFLCKPAERTVTLFVHGWHQVEPGLLSWTFPSLRAALDAVQRMKNAIAWCVVSGTGWEDLDTARARGAVLVEQVA